MQENVSNGNLITPILFPYEQEKFWQINPPNYTRRGTKYWPAKSLFPLLKLPVWLTSLCTKSLKSVHYSILQSQPFTIG